MDIFPKFLIIGDNLIIAKCTYHKQLILEDNIKTIKGGGWWRRGINGEFILNGDSFDYGKATFQNILKCVEQNNVFTNKYMTHKMLNYDICFDSGSEIINISEKIKNQSEYGL